jgi:hypothetical protein
VQWQLGCAPAAQEQKVEGEIDKLISLAFVQRGLQATERRNSVSIESAWLS